VYVRARRCIDKETGRWFVGGWVDYHFNVIECSYTHPIGLCTIEPNTVDKTNINCALRVISPGTKKKKEKKRKKKKTDSDQKFIQMAAAIKQGEILKLSRAEQVNCSE
jgi:hypothetical protein